MLSGITGQYVVAALDADSECQTMFPFLEAQFAWVVGVLSLVLVC